MILYTRSPHLSNAELNELFSTAWENHQERDFIGSLDRNSQFWVCARDHGKLVGFVKVVWDRASHGFIVDTTTHPSYQHRGIDRNLLAEAIEMAKHRGIEWIHVDFDARYESFYRNVGFRPTGAGLINLKCGA